MKTLTLTPLLRFYFALIGCDIPKNAVAVSINWEIPAAFQREYRAQATGALCQQN